MKSAKPFWMLLPFQKLREWRQAQRDKNAAFNANVRTRQVVRAELFREAFAEARAYNNEPRFRRRKIARSMARRLWKERRAA